MRDEQGYPVALRAGLQLWLLKKSWALRYLEIALAYVTPRVRSVVFPVDDPAMSCPVWVELLCGDNAAIQDTYRQTTGRYLLKLKEMADARYVRFGAFLIYYEWGFDDEPWDGIHSNFSPEWLTVLNNCNKDKVGQYRRFMRTLLSQHHIDLRDPYEAIVKAKREDPARKLWGYRDHHFSPAGHSLMADEMFTFWKHLTGERSTE